MLDGVWDSQLENEKEAKNLRRQNIIKILQQNTIQFFLSATVAKLLFSVAEFLTRIRMQYFSII